MMERLIDSLHKDRNLSDGELRVLIESCGHQQKLFEKADSVRREHYGTDVYIRGLIEFSNYCRNNCYYCGIRKDNQNINRYRLSKDEILSCCRQGYGLGFRTFVLQSGEDAFFTDELVCEIVSAIKTSHPDCAITLSMGEKSSDACKAWFDAGADRYLLRHETANISHYKQLHPAEMCSQKRKECLWNLKKIGYQVGSGFMIGAPYQTTDFLIEDLRFLQELQPDMIGVGPYISHQRTPFHNFPNGDLHTSLRLISILRLMFPSALIPATTALGTIDGRGRELGLKAGANVVMPNLSPDRVRRLYELYDNKIFTNEEAAECRVRLESAVAAAGYEVVVHTGHAKSANY